MELHQIFGRKAIYPGLGLVDISLQSNSCSAHCSPQTRRQTDIYQLNIVAMWQWRCCKLPSAPHETLMHAINIERIFKFEYFWAGTIKKFLKSLCFYEVRSETANTANTLLSLRGTPIHSAIIEGVHSNRLQLKRDDCIEPQAQTVEWKLCHYGGSLMFRKALKSPYCCWTVVFARRNKIVLILQKNEFL